MLDYRLKRSSRRTIGFTIDGTGLAITAPRWVTIGAIESAIAEKEKWIFKKLDEWQTRGWVSLETGDVPEHQIALDPAVEKAALHAADVLLPQLTAEQSDAVDAITGAKGFAAFLLHGVTGSGKTEIYLRAIEEVVRQGKEAIVLVTGKVQEKIEPMAWTRYTSDKSRVFYTSLGFPSNFGVSPFHNLLVNGIYWALNLKAP